MSATFASQQREGITQMCGEIVAMLKTMPLCEWQLSWRTEFLQSLDDPGADCAAVVLWALKGFRRLCYDAQKLNVRVNRLQDARDETREIVTAPTLPVIIPAIPEQKISVTNPTQKAVLFTVGNSGLARKWRLIPRVAELAQVARGTVRNALDGLTKAGLVELYQYRGEPAGYQYGKGGRPRALYTLTEDGLSWYRHNYGEPVPSELDQFVSRHKGVQHAVNILEARDLLRGLGLRVDDDPEPMLASAARWGKRSEPDLSLYRDGAYWPVEVQREVRTRNNAKWGKILKLSEGRLILILETNARMQVQAKLLRSGARALPQGTVLLSSLESLRESRTAVEWDEVVTGTGARE